MTALWNDIARPFCDGHLEGIFQAELERSRIDREVLKGLCARDLVGIVLDARRRIAKRRVIERVEGIHAKGKCLSLIPGHGEVFEEG